VTDSTLEKLKELYLTWIDKLPVCTALCDGDLPGKDHAEDCPMKGKEPAGMFDAFCGGYTLGLSQGQWLSQLEYLRRNGWSVAIHNDYRQNGESFTFWLLVDSEGWTVKGEGNTDAEAFAEIVSKLPISDVLLKAVKNGN
jgi:hypothetical protein